MFSDARNADVNENDKALKTALRTVETFERLAGENREAFEPDLARSLNNLGSRYSSLGRRYEAL